MRRGTTFLLISGAWFVFQTGVAGQILNQDRVREMRERELEKLAVERLERFIEDTYEFFELSGELVSFRVSPAVSEAELEAIEMRSRELDDRAERLIAYVREVAPYVRGRTEGLWVVLEPPTEGSSLNERLTLILALVNRIEPKIHQLIDVLQDGVDPTIPVEQLRLEASAPYLIVGGLEELRSMTQDLRGAL